MSHDVLRRLDVLVGDWEIRLMKHGEPLGTGRTTFTWIESDNFLVQHTPAMADAELPPELAENSPLPTVCIFGLDDTRGLFTMLYADARDVQRVCQMSLDEREWKIWRDASGFSQRFTSTISEDCNEIDGRWEYCIDGTNWEYDFDLIYRRITRPSQVLTPSW